MFFKMIGSTLRLKNDNKILTLIFFLGCVILSSSEFIITFKFIVGKVKHDRPQSSNEAPANMTVQYKKGNQAIMAHIQSCI